MLACYMVMLFKYFQNFRHNSRQSIGKFMMIVNYRLLIANTVVQLLESAITCSEDEIKKQVTETRWVISQSPMCEHSLLKNLSFWDCPSFPHKNWTLDMSMENKHHEICPTLCAFQPIFMCIFCANKQHKDPFQTHEGIANRL